MHRGSAVHASPVHRSEAPEAVVRPGPRPAAHAAGDVEGRSDSPEAVRRLTRAVEDLRAAALQPILEQALRDMGDDKPMEGAAAALRALEIDENNGWGWYILAICREKAGAFAHALHCYDRALAIMPDNKDLPNDLGRLAARMGMNEIAEKLFIKFLLLNPGSVDGANNLACAQRAQSRFGDAIETLRPFIEAYPERPLLWNTLGTVLYDQGSMAQAMTFFDEALRLDPDFCKARYNRANVLSAHGRAREAWAECDLAIAGSTLETETAMMRLARSTIMLAAGAVGEGWDAYEARMDPLYPEAPYFLVEDRPQWTPGDLLTGRRLLVFGEQGLGDEVLFANLLPDVIAALGDEALLTLALEPRLIPLFRASFPRATVIGHATYRVDHQVVTMARELDPGSIDLWTPIGSLLRRFRREVGDFPAARGFLKPDPERVAHWRAVLDAVAPGPKVGVL